MLPIALKSCPKSNKSPNLVTLVSLKNSIGRKFCFSIGVNGEKQHWTRLWLAWPTASIVKIRLKYRWHHLLVISSNKQGIILGGVGYHIGGVGAVHMPCWLQNFTVMRGLRSCWSCLNNKRLWRNQLYSHTVNFNI